MLGRVRVAGHSMEPALRSGDHLLFARIPPCVGSVVVARDPRDRSGVAGAQAPCDGQARWIVKRVAAIQGPHVVLVSDHPGHETIAVDRSAIVGRAVLRYRPRFSLARGLRPPSTPGG